MKVYVGQSRASKAIAALAEAGFGECVQRGEGLPRRLPWFMDNGAFRDWKAGRSFDGDAFVASFERLAPAPASRSGRKQRIRGRRMDEDGRSVLVRI